MEIALIAVKKFIDLEDREKMFNEIIAINS